MGRKTQLTYPRPTPGATPKTEAWHYDTAGRTDSFTNRAGNIQTLTYDALNRVTQSSWNDGGVTPTVTYGYDIASRLIDINNPPNATIHRAYWNDNLLTSETETATGGPAKTVTYYYDADGNRSQLRYPDRYIYQYDYTQRNQLWKVGVSLTNPHATYIYDLNGNLQTATLNLNQTHTDYVYDALDQVHWVTHTLVGAGRWFSYDYDAVGNRKWSRWWNGQETRGDVFGYDLADQVDAVQLNILNPDTTPPGDQSIFYDANGNRTTFSAYGPTDTYQTNDLNQYSSRNSNSASYDAKANMLTSPDVSANKLTCTYDAQNRVLTAAKTGGVMLYFTYDGLNRQVTRKVGTGSTIYNVYDGWDLIEECDSAGTIQAEYYYGATGVLFSGSSQRPSQYYWVYHYQNGEGSTSYLASTAGAQLESYRYDLHGTPFVNGDVNNHASSYFVRHLFTGQQWYAELGLYDLRNRFYSPDIGRFIQPDPAEFEGDATNLYRYCGNNSLTGSDPLGLDTFFGYRYIATSIATNASAIGYHQFVYTTNPDGSLANTYSWGTNSLTCGTWASNYAKDVTAASTSIQKGFGSWQGSAALDPYVNVAYNIASTVDPGHPNLVGPTCRAEAASLVSMAQFIQQVDKSGGGYLDFTNGPNTYWDATTGLTYVYDSNWNWVGAIDQHGHMNKGAPSSGSSGYLSVGSSVSWGHLPGWGSGSQYRTDAGWSTLTFITPPDSSCFACGGGAAVIQMIDRGKMAY